MHSTVVVTSLETKSDRSELSCLVDDSSALRFTKAGLTSIIYKTAIADLAQKDPQEAFKLMCDFFSVPNDFLSSQCDT